LSALPLFGANLVQKHCETISNDIQRYELGCENLIVTARSSFDAACYF
jgi:hypothetical protein